MAKVQNRLPKGIGVMNLFFIIVICSVAVVRADDDMLSEPVELSLDQLDRSLHIDSDELKMDEMLSLVDSSESVTEQRASNESALQAIDKKSDSVVGTRILDDRERIDVQFENTDLENLITQISELFDVTFIRDDSISPLPAGGKAVKGNKISFKTYEPLTKDELWNLFVTFLDIAGLAVVSDGTDKIYRITATATAKKSPLRAFIGVSPDLLPDNDQLVRFLYFVENGSLETIQKIVDSVRSSASSFFVLKDLNAFVLTDKALNIKSLMKIVTELDRAAMPESMSVLKLHRVNAQDVKKLYDSLIKPSGGAATSRLFPARKQPTAVYFPENARIIAEPRTNSLILLGPVDAIKRIEDFVIKYVDVELGQESRSPLRIYPLRYADATAVANIMTDITKFGKNTEAGKIGGVRDGDKFLSGLVFTAEPTTNRLIIRGEEEDYLHAKEILEKLDEPQPQVAIEVLIMTVDLKDTKRLGTQIRSKTDNKTTLKGGHSGLTGTNVKFQTSGINFGDGARGFALNSVGEGVKKILGNLISLASGATTGNSVITLGADKFGVWGIFNALDTVSNTQVISNPFLTVSNKQKGYVEVGTVRRVPTSIVTAGTSTTQGFSDNKASLIVEVTPQINSDGMIVLDLDITVDDFSDPTNPTDARKSNKHIKTSATLADKEVLALGGLIKNKIDNSGSQVPVLHKIPLLGWLFKNKEKDQSKENLLILISTKILPPDSETALHDISEARIDEYVETIDTMEKIENNRDPVSRYLFKEGDTTEKALDNFLLERNDRLNVMQQDARVELRKQEARSRQNQKHQEKQNRKKDKQKSRKKKRQIKKEARKQRRKNA